jgi:hypothetical protein
VGFNAVVDGAVVEKDAMVLHLARVAPGVRIPSGRTLRPGAFVRTQAEAAAKTDPVTPADREFMRGVVEVNTELAAGYSALRAEDPSHVRGINYNPPTSFNDRDLPILGGTPTRDPDFRNRIIGDVRTDDSKGALSAKMGDNVSLRADEGDRFTVGTVRAGGGDGGAAAGGAAQGMASRHVQHALEHTELALGDDGRYGFHSLVHGGPADHNPTRTGAGFTLGEYAVFFRSRAGDHVTVHRLSLVQQADLPDGASVPACTVQLGAARSAVEWCDVPFPGPQAPHAHQGGD